MQCSAVHEQVQQMGNARRGNMRDNGAVVVEDLESSPSAARPGQVA